MAKTKGILGTLLAVGTAAAAAAAAVYYKREQIRDLLDDIAERFRTEDADEAEDFPAQEEEEECGLVIDVTVEHEPSEETKESGEA